MTVTRRPLQRLRAGWRVIAEATAATTVAWVLATQLIGHRLPFFAPVAALIVLGQARGQRVRRAFEVWLGVAAGVLVAETLAQALGRHEVWTVLLIVLSTMTVANALGAGTVLIVQASVSALYVAIVPASVSGGVSNRFVDALVGGAVALAVSQLIASPDALQPLRRELDGVLAEVAEVVEEVAVVLAESDATAAMTALARARAADARVHRLVAAVAESEESVWLRLGGRQRTAAVQRVEQATRQIDYIVRGVRVLARSAVTIARQGGPLPDSLPQALHLFAHAARSAASELLDVEPGTGQEASADLTLEAARAAGLVLAGQPALAVVMMVGQLRASCIDLLRAVGRGDDEAIELVESAMGLPR